MEEYRSAFKILTGKPTGNRPLGRPRHRWEDTVRLDLKEIGISTKNWIDLAQDRDYWRALLSTALKSPSSISRGALTKLVSPFLI